MEESKPDPGEDTCTNREIGDGVTCEGDVNILKQKLWDLCAHEGLIFTSLNVVDEGLLRDSVHQGDLPLLRADASARSSGGHLQER